MFSKIMAQIFEVLFNVPTLEKNQAAVEIIFDKVFSLSFVLSLCFSVVKSASFHLNQTVNLKQYLHVFTDYD